VDEEDPLPGAVQLSAVGQDRIGGQVRHGVAAVLEDDLLS
jgi:hypothetical protein